jgi:hypothetical protein
MWDLSFSILDKYCPELNTNPPYGYTLQDSPFLLRNAVFNVLSNEKVDVAEATKDIFSMIQSCEHQEKILEAISFDETVQRAKTKREEQNIERD